MPVTIKQTVNLRLADMPPVEPGQETAEIPTEALSAATQVVTMQCDNPGCKKGVAQSVKVVSWDAQSAATDPAGVPDDAYRIITVELFNGDKKAFCGRSCAVEALQLLAPLRSPREQTKLIQFPDNGR